MPSSTTTSAPGASTHHPSKEPRRSLIDRILHQIFRKLRNKPAEKLQQLANAPSLTAIFKPQLI